MKIIGLVTFLQVMVAAVLSGCTGNAVDSMTDSEMIEYARSLHERVITIDTHDDIPSNFATAEVDPADPESDRQVTLPKMREGGLDVGFFVVFVGQAERSPEGNQRAYEQAITKFEAIHRMTEDMYPDQIELAYTADDVVRIHESGKLAAVICMENGYPIGNDISRLKEFHERGARYITLAHGGHNDIADSATPRPNETEEEHGGISAFGRQVIAEMNRLGIMVDISHISHKAAMEAMALSKAPVIASHSSTKALNDHPRNLGDEALLALKENGGVMQTVALGAFVKTIDITPERAAALAELREEFDIPAPRGSAYRNRVAAFTPEERSAFDKRMAEIDAQFTPPPAVNVQDYVDHIDHAVGLIGIDHVAIASDFDGGGGIAGWRNASETLNVTIELVRRGYSEEDIRKIWGGNTLRVLRAVERVAAELQRKETE